MRHIFYIILMTVFSFVYAVSMSLYLDSIAPHSGFGSLYGNMLLATFPLGLIPATIACKKGRNFYAWWIYGFLFFVISLIHSFIIKQTEESMLSNGMKKCNYCAELVKEEAKICRYCGKELEPSN